MLCVTGSCSTPPGEHPSCEEISYFLIRRSMGLVSEDYDGPFKCAGIHILVLYAVHFWSLSVISRDSLHKPLIADPQSS
jgi:hypothetical protein